MSKTSGRRHESRNVVVDTHVFYRALAIDAEDEDNVLSHLKRVCDHLVMSDPIREEYIRMAEKAGISSTLVETILQSELEPLNKVRQTNARSKQSPLSGIPEQDHHLIHAAWAARPAYVVTGDHRIQEKRASLKEEGVNVISAQEYLQLR